MNSPEHNIYPAECIAWLRRAVLHSVAASDNNTRVPYPYHYPRPDHAYEDYNKFIGLFATMEALPSHAWDAYWLARSWRMDGAIPAFILDELERIGERVPPNARNIKPEDFQTAGIARGVLRPPMQWTSSEPIMPLSSDNQQDTTTAGTAQASPHPSAPSGVPESMKAHLLNNEYKSILGVVFESTS